MYSVFQIILITIISLIMVFLVAYGSDMIYVIRVKKATIKHEKKLKKENQKGWKKWYI